MSQGFVVMPQNYDDQTPEIPSSDKRGALGSFHRKSRREIVGMREAERRVEMIDGAARIAEYGRTVLDLATD
jgi:hypothetical protein